MAPYDKSAGNHSPINSTDPLTTVGSFFITRVTTQLNPKYIYNYPDHIGIELKVENFGVKEINNITNEGIHSKFNRELFKLLVLHFSDSSDRTFVVVNESNKDIRNTADALISMCCCNDPPTRFKSSYSLNSPIIEWFTDNQQLKHCLDFGIGFLNEELSSLDVSLIIEASGELFLKSTGNLAVGAF